MEDVFKCVCKDCNYKFYTPDDEVDFCPRCGSKNVEVIYPFKEGDKMFVCSEDEREDIINNVLEDCLR